MKIDPIRAFLWTVGIYAVCRFTGIYPLDLIKKETIKIHITNVEGTPGLIDNDYHVYTDKEVFINRDSTLVGKFNSDDIQNYLFLKHDKNEVVNCQAVVVGPKIYGIGKISWLKNILTIQCD